MPEKRIIDPISFTRKDCWIILISSIGYFKISYLGLKCVLGQKFCIQDL